MAVPPRSRPKLSPARREAIRARFRVANGNLKWFTENYSRVQKEYAGRVVVVWKSNVRATGKSIQSATRAAKRKDVPVDDALIQYVPAKNETLFF